jgi:hypothetical protein
MGRERNTHWKTNTNNRWDEKFVPKNGTGSEELSTKKHDAPTTTRMRTSEGPTRVSAATTKSSSFRTRYIVTPDDGHIARNML